MTFSCNAVIPESKHCSRETVVVFVGRWSLCKCIPSFCMGIIQKHCDNETQKVVRTDRWSFYTGLTVVTVSINCNLNVYTTHSPDHSEFQVSMSTTEAPYQRRGRAGSCYGNWHGSTPCDLGLYSTSQERCSYRQAGCRALLTQRRKKSAKSIENHGQNIHLSLETSCQYVDTFNKCQSTFFKATVHKINFDNISFTT